MRIENDYQSLVELMGKFKNVVVTTTDLENEYRVVGPIMQYLSNMGVYADDYEKIKARYEKAPFTNLLISISEFTEKSEKASNTARKLYYGAIKDNDEIMDFQDELDKAAAISLAQLKLRAYGIGANAIVGVHFDVEIDPSSKNLFFIKMYGTAVDCPSLAGNDDSNINLPLDKDAHII